MAIQLDKKQLFNALNNANHIRKYVQEKIAFKVLYFHEDVDGTAKAVIELEDGTVEGLYCSALTGVQSLRELVGVFEDDQPLVRVSEAFTNKQRTVYRIEVQ